MAKTIKVIDLLNKIANGEELPEKIKWNYDENIYTHDGGGYLCYSTGYAREKAFLEGYRTDMMLHTTVEIIEEQQDIDIQNIEEIDGTFIEYSPYKELAKMYNELIKAVKQLDKNIKDKE